MAKHEAKDDVDDVSDEGQAVELDDASTAKELDAVRRLTRRDTGSSSGSTRARAPSTSSASASCGSASVLRSS